MKRTGIILLVVLMLSSPMAMGAVSDAEFAQLRADFAAMAQRLDALAAENAALKQSNAEQASIVADVQEDIVEVQETVIVEGAPSWTDRLSMNGDFRFRYENIDEEGDPERNRARVRARANLQADLPGNVEVGFGLATGGDDPVSANQTLGDGGSSKNISLNLAYANWNAAEGLNLIVGKFKDPLYRVAKNPMMWDGDWTPEGVAMTYQRNWFFLNALGTWLESDSKTGNSNFSWGGQVGATGAIGEAKLKGGVGYYAIKTQGDTTYFGDTSDTGDFYGNTAVEIGSGLACGTTGATCEYLYDYLLTQVFAEVDIPVAGIPVVLFFDAANNSDASDNDTAWALGTRIGKVKDRGQWQFSYWYAEKEADSMFGLLTDSDWAGGGTNNKGQFFQLGVGINKSWAVSVQYFINEINISTTNPSDYNRLMLDTQWKWK